MKILYLSYDGLTDPLGGSQILPYLIGLAKRGHQFHVIGFEKAVPSSPSWRRTREICDRAGIRWQPLRYHKRPPILSTIWDLRAMKRAALRLQREAGFDVVHCRSYIPALVGLALKRRCGIGFLFDMRGFWPEEKLEGAGWDRNPLLRLAYRYFKARERDFFREADAIVSLTEAARDQMLARPIEERPVAIPTVIPCCVDFDHFTLPSPADKASARRALGIAEDGPVLAYLGSLGGNYLLDEMLRFFAAFRAKCFGARLLFITREAPAPILRQAERHGIPADEIVIRGAERDEVPKLTSAADYGVAFKRAGFAETACSPTKLGEMMALGIPVSVNSGVGDVERIVGESRSGVVLHQFDSAAVRSAVDRLLAIDRSPSDIRRAAGRWFRLEQAVESYDAIYHSLGAARAAN